MVVHEAISPVLKPKKPAILGQKPKIESPVFIVEKNSLTAISSMSDMVRTVRNDDPGYSCHSSFLSIFLDAENSLFFSIVGKKTGRFRKEESSGGNYGTPYKALALGLPLHSNGARLPLLESRNKRRLKFKSPRRKIKRSGLQSRNLSC
jgi:hypothetical protein